MFERILRELRDRHFWILLFLSLAILLCVYQMILPSPIFINLGTEGDERYLSNFHVGEQGELYPFRWTRASSYIKIPSLASLPLEIILAADAGRPEGQLLPRVALIANGAVLADFTIQNGIRAHQFFYYPSRFPWPRDLLLTLKSDTFVPPGDEHRALGILLNTVEIKPTISPLRLFQVSSLASLIGAFPIALSYLLLRRLGASQKASLICGIVVLVLLSLGIGQRFIVTRFLVGVSGLLLVGYVLAVLLEAGRYRGFVNNLSAFFAKRNEIPDVLPAYLPAVVLFILMPFAVYLPNQKVLDNNLTLVIPYLILAVVYFISLIALLLFVCQPLRTRIVVPLFYTGLHLCLSDIMSPVQLGELMGGRETPTQPFFLTAVEVALVVVVVFGAIKLPWKHVKYFGSVFVLLLLICEAIVVFNALLPETSLALTQPIKSTSSPPGKLADGGNVYHITFDGYSSVSFLESLDEMRLTEDFGGFTFFEKNRSNYMFTEESLPSYMTGSFYEGNDGLKDWMDRHKSSGIVNNVYDTGYEVSVYVPSSGWVNPRASHVKVYDDVLMQYKSLSSLCHFADLWLLRVVPNFLQRAVYREGRGVFTRSFVKEDRLAGKNADVFASLELTRQLIDDEADRPDHGQYVYAHMLLPHSPFVMDRDCVFSSGDTDYEEQALCATRLMTELVSELKELGKYRESTIVFQSDHGTPRIEGLDLELSLDIKREIETLNPRGVGIGQIESRTRALLLIKPPLQSAKPLVISDRPTQLVDIPATIYDLLGFSVHAKEGESAFSPGFPHTREIHTFAGLRIQTDEKGKEYRFGENLFEGEANHLSFTNGRGWKIYPNILVRWE